MLAGLEVREQLGPSGLHLLTCWVLQSGSRTLSELLDLAGVGWASIDVHLTTSQESKHWFGSEA